MTVTNETEIWAEADARAAQGDLEGALARLLDGYERVPLYRYALQLSRWVRSHEALATAYAPARRAVLALVGSSTLEPLGAFVEAECLRSGVWPTVHVGGFNRFHAELLAEDSALVAAKPDVVFLSAGLDALLPGFDRFAATPRARLDGAVAALQALVRAVHERSGALLVVHNFAADAAASDVAGADPSLLGPRRFVREANLRLADAFAGDARTVVLDFDFIVAGHGAGRAVDPKMRYLAGLEMGDELMRAVAQRYAGYVKTLKGLARKCVVVDLDGTLWGGIVGEDGPDGLRLGDDASGRPYRDFQRYLLSLWTRGVLLAVNSKNNPDDALAVIRAHPGMVLREAHFASLQINWEDKTRNMLRIVDELNVGVDSLVFVDDNPAERLRMRQELPEVLTLELPADASRYVATLAALNDFEVLTLTEEDRRRGVLYAEDRARRMLRAEAGSFEAYLAALKMTVTIRPPTAGELARVAQLTQKTNQFNMTTRRYGAAQLDGRRAFIVRVTDAFGDHGLVGVAIADARDDAWHLDTLLMSCRVLGRRVEDLFVQRIAAAARAAGARRLTAEYIPTAKNQIADGFYAACGFREEPARGDTARWFTLDLDGMAVAPPGWLTLVEDA